MKDATMMRRWQERHMAIQKLQHQQSQESAKLRSTVRRLILRAIYQEAAGRFPYEFDAVLIHCKLRENRTPVPWDLFVEVLRSFGFREKVRGADDSQFDIKQHYCYCDAPIRIRA